MKVRLVKVSLAACLAMSGIMALNAAAADSFMVDPVSGDLVSQDHQPNVAAPTDGDPQAILPGGVMHGSLSKIDPQSLAAGGVGAVGSTLTTGTGKLNSDPPADPLHVHDYLTPGEPGSMECLAC